MARIAGAARCAASAIQRFAFRADLADRHPLPSEPAVARCGDAGRPRRRAPATAFRGSSSHSRQAAGEDLFGKLDDTRFNLLLIGQLTAAVPTDRPYVVHPIPDLATNTAALARAGIRAPSYYLLRPDGHIGLAGTRLQEGEVQRYLSEHVGGMN